MFRENFSDWLKTIQKSGERLIQDHSKRSRVEGIIAPVLILFSPENPNDDSNVVKIEMEDFQLEIEYWNSAICCWC